MHQSFKLAQTDTSSHVLFDSTELLEAKVKQYTDAGKIPIVAMYMKYDHISDSAFVDSLLYFDQSDTSIHDVAGRTASPFSTSSVFAAATGVGEIQQGICKFILPSDLYLSNMDKTLSKAEIKLGAQAQWQEMTMNTDLSADLSNIEGDLVFELRFTYSDGTIKISHTPVKFYKTDPYVDAYQNATDTWNISPTSNYYGATVNIAYGCGKTKLTKPFIIVEPFDPTDKMNFGKTMKELVYKSPELIKEMEAQGYDLVYIDFTYNVDYLERNTAVVQEVINRVNTEKAANGSSEPNVILGISMGGVLGKNALRLMEIANVDHQTKTFFSLDAPHRGAYIPLSLQWFMHDIEAMSYDRIHIPFIGNFQYYKLDAKTLKALNIIKSPAAEQLLVGNIFDNSNACATFFNTYNNNGALQHCNEFALTNGSISGKKQQYDISLINYADVPDGSLLGLIMEFGKDITPMNMGLAGYTLKSDMLFKFYGLSYTPQMIYKGVAKLHLYMYITGTLVDYGFDPINTEINGFGLPIDNAPGGYASISDMGMDINSIKKSMGLYGLNIYSSNFCFVPTISSLNIQNTFDLYYDVIGHSTINHISYGSFTGNVYFPTGFTTPFQLFSSPSTTTTLNNFWNESHSAPSANSGFILGLKLMGAPKAQCENLTLIDNVNFNFGYKSYWSLIGEMFTTGDLIYNDLTVKNNGILYINGNEYLGNGVSPVPGIYCPYPDINSSIEVSSSGKVCGATGKSIDVQNTGSLILGSSTDSRTGNLRMSSGSVLTLETGSSFTAYTNSKLIIDDGATLYINDGVPVTLAGTNAKIEVRKGGKLFLIGNPQIALAGSNSSIEIQDGGELNIPTGTTFTFTGAGFVKCYGGNGTKTVITGSGSINLTGTGKNNKVLEFEGTNSGVILHIANTIQALNITDGMVVNGCDISFSMPVSFTNSNFNSGRIVDFLSSLWATHSQFSGVNNCYDNIDIDLSDIYGPLSAVSINSPKHVYIYGSTFTYADNGQGALHLIGTNNPFLHFLKFINNGIGLNAEYITGNVTCQQCKFYHTQDNLADKGVTFFGSTGSSLYLDRTDITNMRISGVEIEGGELFANCGMINRTDFTDVSTSVKLNTGSVLMIDQYKSGGITVGNMDFSGHSVTILATDAEMINIDNGYSNLNNLLPNNYDGNVLNGNITNKVNQLDATYNYWNRGVAPNWWDHYSNFSDGSSPAQFNSWTAHTVNGNNFFPTLLDIDAACPSRYTVPIGGGGGESFGKTSNIHSTKFIDSLSNIPYKNGQNLKQVMQHVYNYGTDTTDSGLNDQLDYYEQVLKHNFGNHKSKAAPALSAVYRKMNQGISVGLKHGIIQHQSTSLQLNKLIHVQDTLLNRTATNDSMNRFKLITDKALTLRLANRRMDAMPLLNQAHNLANKNGKKHIEKWQCFIDKEMQLQNGLITKQQFLAEIKLCGMPDTSMSKRSRYDYYTPPSNDEDNKPVPLTDIATTKTEVLLYPNPALDNLNIEIKNLAKESEINIVVLDIVGRIMYTGTQHANEKNAVLNIPINLSSGTYFIKLSGEHINETKRFSVMR